MNLSTQVPLLKSGHSNHCNKSSITVSRFNTNYTCIIWQSLLWSMSAYISVGLITWLFIWYSVCVLLWFNLPGSGSDASSCIIMHRYVPIVWFSCEFHWRAAQAANTKGRAFEPRWLLVIISLCHVKEGLITQAGHMYVID